MRVVGGSLRGRPIAAPPGDNVRPTSDRARESIFNILANRQQPDGTGLLQDAVVLDGFCGTGAFGIEALSRGARHAWMLDCDIRPAQRNIAALDIADDTTPIRGDMAKPPPAPGVADIVFLDPPYDDADAAVSALDGLIAAGWVGPDTLVVLELPAAGSELEFEGYEIEDRRRYGAAAVLFMTRAAG